VPVDELPFAIHSSIDVRNTDGHFVVRPTAHARRPALAGNVVRKVAENLEKQDYRDKDIEQLAILLGQLFNTRGSIQLRKALSPKRRKERNVEAVKATGAADKAAWLRDHPGRTAKDYGKLLNTEEMTLWRGEINRRVREAEKAAWEHDHPGEAMPRESCSMTEADVVRLEYWRETRRK
jgi:hypothetical protein